MSYEKLKRLLESKRLYKLTKCDKSDMGIKYD